jgi:transcriptional regulator with PAS, ATPase and Fis domain
MFPALVPTSSRLFRSTLDAADRFAAEPWPVLILGETGVGKELLAHRLHLKSQLKGRFIPLNCGALPPALVESELFGYERGAFSGAVQSSRGLVRQAQGGTLFLDEIGEMDLNLQVKLLRLLDSGEIRSLGGTQVERVSVRILAATNVDLDAAVQERRFRADLLERLSVLTLQVPALRERKEDLPQLARNICESARFVWDEALAPQLKDFDWPGNVRQLRNVLVRTAVLGGGRMTAGALQTVLAREKARAAATGANPLSGTLAEIEKQVIVERLRRNHGNRKRTARDLGIAKSTLHEKLRRWQMDSDAAWPIARCGVDSALSL